MEAIHNVLSVFGIGDLRMLLEVLRSIQTHLSGDINLLGGGPRGSLVGIVKGLHRGIGLLLLRLGRDELAEPLLGSKRGLGVIPDIFRDVGDYPRIADVHFPELNVLVLLGKNRVLVLLRRLPAFQDAEI